MTTATGSTAIDESLADCPPPSYGDPTGETAIRNILTGIDFAPRSDWRLYGPDGGDGFPVTVLLAPDLARAFFEFVRSEGEVRPSRSGRSYRARLRVPR